MNSWETPVGTFDVQMTDLGIARVQEASGQKYEPLDDRLTKQLNEHLDGAPISMRLDLQGIAPFRQVTLAKLLEIPYGEVRSYSWVAREIGRPAAIRAVASAVARNPVPLLIPCHRVVRSDGALGEYSLVGPELKRQILGYEGLDIEWIESLTKRGVRFLGDEKTHTFHTRTCKLVPGADDPSYLELRTAKDAEKQLLKPCRRCRPILVY